MMKIIYETIILVYYKFIFIAIKILNTLNVPAQPLEKLVNNHSIRINRLIWNSHDWSDFGNEWSSEDKKLSLAESIMYKYMVKDGRNLEIGPGGGRWTEYLLGISKELVLVDLSEQCIDVCRKRFINVKNIKYYVNDGRNLEFLSNESINSIWSFDVFVHIDIVTTYKYLGEFSRVLKQNGTAVIHLPRFGNIKGGWRSELSEKKFVEMLKTKNLNYMHSITSWGFNSEFDLEDHSDVIIVFSKN